MFTFRSYSWVIGTTSFRVKEVNYRIEEQLRTLNELFQEFPDESWENNQRLQEAYYDKLQEKGLIEGNAPNKAKDARQKSSVLKELGLVTEHREITEVGEEILRLVEQEQITASNDFMIDADAMVYLKQFLKVFVQHQDFEIKPFIAFLYMLDKLDYLSAEEFTYLLPICRNKNDVQWMVNEIVKLRLGETSIELILSRFMKRMDNYEAALHYFLNVPTVTPEVICAIGMNRKSRKLDIPYYDLYNELLSLRDEKSLPPAKMKKLQQCVKQLSGKANVSWKKLLFGEQRSAQQQWETLKANISRWQLVTGDELEFRRLFFHYMHLIKWQLNLEEYADLNKRFFSLADVVTFRNERAELTLYAKYYFHLCIDALLEEPIRSESLERNMSLAEISSALLIDSEDVVALVSQATGKTMDVPSMRHHFRTEKEKQLAELIEQKFSKDKLVKLLEWIEQRDDKKVQDYVTENADVPTIFEYVLGICWYQISGRSINLLDSWNMSLDAELLPKRHAGGGGADIVISYPQTTTHARHQLLLEATLTSKTNQRRAEMEPVSRHLGNIKAQDPDMETYCVFIANHLDTNVVVDLRARKFIPFHDYATGTWVRDNKIIPLSTDNVKTLLVKNLTYSALYTLFAEAYDTEVEFERWYDETINKALSS